jgi:hypothetical protein
VNNPSADLGLQFLRQPRRHRTRRQPARLRMADQAARANAQVEADLGQLRRLARAGFAADDHHLVLCDQLADVGAPLVDRQVGLEFRFRQLAAPRGHRGPRCGEQGRQAGLRLVALCANRLAQLARQRTQSPCIGGQCVVSRFGRAGRRGFGRMLSHGAAL